MKTISAVFAAALLASTSSAALAAPDARIKSLEDQIHALSQQLQDLKAATEKQQEDAKAQAEEAKKAKAEAIAHEAETKKQMATAPKPGIANGRLSVSSSDGAFTASIRALLQLDTGYYMQQKSAQSLPTAYGPDLSSGSNLRRVFLGLQGKVFNDWSYYFLYDFGGATTETPGKLLYAYMQYDGFGPWAVRVGAFPAPINFEDQTASGDLIFFERNSPSNLQRNIAGSEGREGISLLYTTPRMFGALNFTGNKISDGVKAYGAMGSTAVPNYDEQTAVSGRLAYMPLSGDNYHILIGANGANVFNLPQLMPNGAATLATTPGKGMKGSYSFADLPEFSVDSNGMQLVSTGALSASHVTTWGLETAGNVGSFYGQAGYYSYAVHRSPISYNVYTADATFAPHTVAPSNDTFSGWYVQGAYVLTGESRTYNPATGSFTAPKVAKPFSLKDGTWGAFEIAARFSDLNLNSHANDTANVITDWAGADRTYTYYNTVRGGEQKIVTIGLNWFLNTAVRVSTDYQYIDVSRLQAPATVKTSGTPALPTLNGGQKLSTVEMRFQLSL